MAKDEWEAALWYRKAAGAGNANGMAFYGDMLEDGKGVAKNLNEAIDWYQKAARLGSEFAQKALKRLNKTW